MLLRSVRSAQKRNAECLVNTATIRHPDLDSSSNAEFGHISATFVGSNTGLDEQQD
jgi:hypothetical protein